MEHNISTNHEHYCWRCLGAKPND